MDINLTTVEGVLLNVTVIGGSKGTVFSSIPSILATVSVIDLSYVYNSFI